MRAGRVQHGELLGWLVRAHLSHFLCVQDAPSEPHLGISSQSRAWRHSLLTRRGRPRVGCLGLLLCHCARRRSSKRGFCAVQGHLGWGQTCRREGNQTQQSLRHLQVLEGFLNVLAAVTWMKVEKLSQPSSAGKPSRELGENHHHLLALWWI